MASPSLHWETRPGGGVSNVQVPQTRSHPRVPVSAAEPAGLPCLYGSAPGACRSTTRSPSTICSRRPSSWVFENYIEALGFSVKPEAYQAALAEGANWFQAAKAVLVAHDPTFWIALRNTAVYCGGHAGAGRHPGLPGRLVAQFQAAGHVLLPRSVLHPRRCLYRRRCPGVVLDLQAAGGRAQH